MTTEDRHVHLAILRFDRGACGSMDQPITTFWRDMTCLECLADVHRRAFAGGGAINQACQLIVDDLASRRAAP